MILLIFAIFISSFSTVMLFSNSTYQAIDHAFTTLNYALPDEWIVTDLKEPLPTPMYDVKKVEETTIKHLKSNLAHYVKSFKVGFYYYDSKSKEEMDEMYVTGVRISLRANVPFREDYYKSNTYEIVEPSI